MKKIMIKVVFLVLIVILLLTERKSEQYYPRDTAAFRDTVIEVIDKDPSVTLNNIQISIYDMGYDKNTKAQTISFTMKADELSDTEMIFTSLFKGDMQNKEELIQAISSVLSNVKETEKSRSYLPERTLVYTTIDTETRALDIYVAAEKGKTKREVITESIQNSEQYKEAESVTLYYIASERLDIFCGSVDLLGCFSEEYREVNPLLFTSGYMKKIIEESVITQLK